MSDSTNDGVQAPVERILGLVSSSLNEAARGLVPWFYESMPPYYFRTHSEEEQVSHLHALVSGQVTTDGHVLSLRSPCGTKNTLISPGGGMNEFTAAVAQMADKVVLNARMYTSSDRKLRLDTFILSPQGVVDRTSESFAQAIAQTRESALVPESELDAFIEFLATATGDCVDKFEAERAARHFEIYKRIRGTARVHVTMEPEAYPGLSRIIVSMMSPPTHGALLTMIKILQRAGADVSRAYADVYSPLDAPLGIVSFYIRSDGFKPAGSDEAWQALRHELRAVKWFASGHALEVYADTHGWTVQEVMFLMAASEFAHQFLLKLDAYAFTSHNVVRAVLGNPELSRAMLDYFVARFDPQGADRAQASRQALDRVRTMRKDVSGEVASKTFEVIETFISHTLRTNYFVDNHFGLGFRMDPSVLSHLPHNQGHPGEQDLPYGFYFFHGAHFQGFHVRYREMARGGVRIVPTRSQENFELESNRQFDEVTALAKSQQHKNKDIPEGGSKAVLLLGPLGDMDLALRSMVNSLLDLMLTDGDRPSLPEVVDYLGKEEIIFLGPDENVTGAHVEWIVDRAARRGYRWPSAIMSSKPRTGISHKQYGVTSLGVVVFAEEVLKLLDIDPDHDTFSVKFTGGTRGDVAGNAMTILMDKYGDRVRIVAATDGHGAVHDPDGMDHEELRRLIAEDRDLCDFDASRLRGKGAVALCTTDPGGAQLRDSLHNSATADLFIPAGGRPDTINAKNWEAFMTPEGKPSARAIIEGANIFISDEARSLLQGQGVVILHGASANKCGVISSSYEILAGLALTDDEFLAIKDEYVAQVLDILGERARGEARLLIREYKSCGGCRPMTELSMALSKEINTLADMMDRKLRERFPTAQDIAGDPVFYPLLLDYCPPVLTKTYAHRLIESVPLGHLTALLAAYSSSRAVYAEGIGWMQGLADVHDIAEVMSAYLSEEKKLIGYLDGLDHSDAPQRDEMARILRASGRKYLTGRALGMEPD